MPPIFNNRPISYSGKSLPLFVAHKPIFDIDGTPLKYNATPKILGFTLDEQLTFEDHIKSVSRKASNSLRVIREIKGIATVSTSKLIRLYTSLVRSIMDYGAVVWQCSKYTSKLAKYTEESTVSLLWPT